MTQITPELVDQYFESVGNHTLEDTRLNGAISGADTVTDSAEFKKRVARIELLLPDVPLVVREAIFAAAVRIGIGLGLYAASQDDTVEPSAEILDEYFADGPTCPSEVIKAVFGSKAFHDHVMSSRIKDALLPPNPDAHGADTTHEGAAFMHGYAFAKYLGQ